MPRKLFIAAGAALTFFALFLASRYLGWGLGQSEPTVCHLFNEGFFISDGKTKVLTDAFVRYGYPEDQLPSPELLTALENSAPPFDHVTLITVSHSHIDHFNPASLVARLSSDPDVHVLLPEMTLIELLANQGNKFSNRLHGYTPFEGSPERIVVNGMVVGVYNLDHMTGPEAEVENNGYLFEVGGKTFFHMGDIATDDFSGSGLEGLAVDYLLIPYWYYLDPADREDYLTKIEAGRIIPIHLPTPDNQLEYLQTLGGWDVVEESIRNLSPKIRLLYDENACLSS